MTESFKEFRKRMLKIDQPRHHKITNSVGLYEAFRWCRKNKLCGIGREISESEFYKIISTVHKKVIEQLYQGKSFKMPENMGILELRIYRRYLKLEEGKVKTNRRVNWGATLKLWEEDPEAMKEKVVVRRDNDREIFVYYNKKNAKYNNKSYVKFRPNRTILQHLIKLLDDGEISAYDLNTIK